MITSWPCLAASMPPSKPRQLITVASGEPTFQDLVPPDHPPSLFAEEVGHSSNEVALQLLFVSQLLALDDSLRFLALLPAHLPHFVAADVDVLTGKELQDLGQHILEKAESLGGGAEDVLEDSPLGGNLERPFGAGELGIGRERRAGVTGHLDFRNDGDEPILRVLDDVLDVL